MPGTDLGSLFASIRPGAVPGTWHRFGDLFASIQPGAAPGAWHRLGKPVCQHPTGRRTGYLAPIWGTCLLASNLAPYRVPGTDLGTLFLVAAR